MSALKVEGEEGEEGVRTEEAVEIIDCGCGSDSTMGSFGFVNQEFSSAPYNYLYPH